MDTVIKGRKDNMDRLTEKLKSGAYLPKVPLYTICDKLGKYEDLEEQGKLLNLPCTFGDTVFVKMISGEYAEAEVKDFSYFHSCGFCVVVTSDKFNKQNIPFSEFGKTVFLTREEAEETIKENP